MIIDSSASNFSSSPDSAGQPTSVGYLVDPPPLWRADYCLPHLCFDPHRQREIEDRSLARLGFDPDAPAVHLDDALGDRQAEAGPALLAGDRAVGLLELLEDFRLIDRGNAGTRVAYRN